MSNFSEIDVTTDKDMVMVVTRGNKFAFISLENNVGVGWKLTQKNLDTLKGFIAELQMIVDEVK